MRSSPPFNDSVIIISTKRLAKEYFFGVVYHDFGMFRSFDTAWTDIYILSVGATKLSYTY